MNHNPNQAIATWSMLVKGKRNTDQSQNKTKFKLKCRRVGCELAEALVQGQNYIG